MRKTLSPALSHMAGKVVVGTAIIFLALSWLLEFVDMVNDRESRISHAVVEIENTATLLREYTTSRMDIYQQSLQALGPTVNLEQLDNPKAATEIHELLNRRRALTPGVYQLSITDDEGILRHSSEVHNPEPLNISDRPYFTPIKEGAPGTIHVSGAIRGEFGSAKSKWIFVVSRRIERADGSFAGAIHAAISINDFSPVFRNITMGPNSVLGIFHQDGTLMVRQPDQEKFIGQNYANLRFMTAVKENPESGMVVLDIGGRPRYQLYQRVPGTPLIVFVAAAEEDLLVPWRDSVINTLIEQSALTITVIVLCLLALGGFKRRAQAEATYLRRLERLAEITGEMMTCKDDESLLKYAAETVRAVVPSHQSAVSFNSAGSMKDALHTTSLSDKYAKWRSYGAVPDGSGIYREVMQNNRPMRLTQDELVKYPSWRNFGKEKDHHPPMRGWMAAPLIGQDGVNIGLVQVSDREDNDFDATDEAIIMQFARVLSIALQTIRLLDETQSSAAESRLMRDELAKVFAATSDGVVLFDQDMRYTFVNDVFCRITAETRDKILGKKFTERPNFDPRTYERLLECRASGKSMDFENHFKAADGVERWIEVKAFPVDEKLSVFVRDVTDRRLAEKKLLEAQRMDAVGRLTGGLAHDFNNMLAVILGNTEMLLTKMKDHPQIRSVELIRTAAKRGADVISRLLSFARRQPLDPKAVDVASVVSDVQTLLRRSLPENVAFEFVKGAGLWQASVDLGQLENVLVNLIINARDALPNGGKVTIEATNAHLDNTYAVNAEVPPGQYVLLAISDTGTGMTPEVAAKAFEPFFTTKPVGKGTGLGLSMVYGFAKQSGGHVRLYSEVGQGTTVKLYLPRAKGLSEAVVSHEDMKVAPRGNETILLVEDEDMVREFVQTMLTDLGYRVISHRDGESAWAEIVAGVKPDMLLTDLILPGEMNGRRLAENVATINSNIGILYMSGYTENAIVHHGRLDPGVHLLTKPFRLYDLAVKVRAVLNARNAVVQPAQEGKT